MNPSARRVRHIVLVRFRADTTQDERAEFIHRSQWSREADYVTNYQCGHGVIPNPYPAADVWDWGMTLDVAEADVERYRDDPRHRATAAAVSRYAEKYAILDFVIDPA